MTPSPSLVMVLPGAYQPYAGLLDSHIARMAEGSGERWSSSDIVKAIQAGDMRVWMAVEDEAVRCVMLTEFSDYPGGRALRLIGLSGEGMLRWVRWWPRVQAFARVCECRWIEAVHPPQYRRLLDRLGGKHFHAITEWTL